MTGLTNKYRDAHDRGFLGLLEDLGKGNMRMQDKLDIKHGIDHGKTDQSLYGMTPRILIVSIIGISLVTFIHVWGMVARFGPYMDETSVPSTAGLSALFLLLLVNLILNKMSSKHRFAPHELVIVYIMVSVGIIVAGLGFITNQVFSIMGPWYQVLTGSATTEAYQILIQRIPAALMPQDEMVAMRFWMGSGDGVPWGAWIMPIILWTLFGLVVMYVFACVANLVRDYWTHKEHLGYPLTLPVLQTFSKTSYMESLWNNRLALAGVGVSAVMGTFGIIHSYFSAVPAFSLTVNLGEFLNEGAWSALADYPEWFTFGFSPFHVGIAYLLPLNVSFSLWFFALFYKLTNVGMNAVGYYNHHPQPGLLFWSWAGTIRAAGAFVTLAMFALWRARHSIADIVGCAMGKSANEQDSNPGLSSRAIVFGGLASLLFIVAFMKVFVGIPVYIMGTLLFCFLSYTLAFARFRAEAGYPSSLFAQLASNEFTMTLLGPSFFNEGARGIGLIYNWSFTTSGAVPAWLLEGYSMADAVKLKRRTITYSVLIAFVVAFVVGFVAFLSLAYNYGAMNFGNDNITRAAGYNAWGVYDTKLRQHEAGQAEYYFESPWFLNMLWGSAVTVFLSLMYSKYVWWPLNPIGYACGLTPAMPAIWSYFLLGWLVKFLVARYGGFGNVKTLYPLFIGFIVGSAMLQVINSVLRFIFPI